MSAPDLDLNADWRKAAASTANGNCVEVAYLPEGVVCVRNSKDRRGPVLRFTLEEWQAFLQGAKACEFDPAV